MKYVSLLALLAGAASATDRPNLNGTWTLDPAHSQIGDSRVKTETLRIQQNDDKIAIADEADNDGKDEKFQFDCLTDGSACKLKDASVMVYYNGPALVVFEMRHNKEIVTKKRLQTSADGKSLSMQIMHVAPAGQKDETLTFVKHE